MSGRATFVFWWENAGDNNEHLPFFNVVENDKGMINGSTVDGDALLAEYGIPLPLFPDFKTWKREVEAGRKCRHCWASTSCAHRLVGVRS